MGESNKYSVLIIGCGRIAGGGENLSESEMKLTHASAYTNHNSYQIHACIEPDIFKRKIFMERWGVKNGFADMKEYEKSGIKCEIVSVCSPTITHAKILHALIEYPLLAVFCEKPLTADINESKLIIDKFRKINIPIAVAYLRRWNKSINGIKYEMENTTWGIVRSVTGYYSKGILNNGSHLLDLVNFLLGEVEIMTVTGKRVDYDDNDPTIDAVLYTDNNIPVHIIGTDSNDYTFFELHLHCEKGVISIEQSGQVIRRRTVRPDMCHLGYKQLQSETWDNPGHGNPYIYALNNIDDVIQKKDVLKSDTKNAYYVQSVCSKLIEMAESL